MLVVVLVLVEVVEVVGKVTHRDEGDVVEVAPMNLIKSTTLHAPKMKSESAWLLHTNFPKYSLPMLAYIDKAVKVVEPG